MKKIYLDDNLTKKIDGIIEQDTTVKYQFIQFQSTTMKFPIKDNIEEDCFIMGSSYNNRGIIFALIPNSSSKLNNVKNSYGDFKLLKNYKLYVEARMGREVRYYVIDDTEVLDKKEKEYLSFVFKPFAKRILSVTKVQNSNNGYQKLVVAFYDKTKMIMPRFEYNTMYRGMELNVTYTIEELGLFQKEYKITLTEFWNSDECLAIHCDTEEKADKLLKAFDKLGKMWCENVSYLKTNCYSYYGQKSCYSNNRCISDCNYFRKTGCTIYEFEDVDLDN